MFLTKVKLEEMLLATQKKDISIKQRYLKYEHHKREYLVLQKTYRNFLEKMRTLQTTESYHVSNVHKVDPAIAGRLQNAWERVLSRTNLFLALAGSHLGMMQRHALSYQAPLYGRATAQLHLQPLPFGVTQAFFPSYDAADRVAIYAMFGEPSWTEGTRNTGLPLKAMVQYCEPQGNGFVQIHRSDLIFTFTCKRKKFIG